ncbi:MAG: PilW family protein [Gammaproteobacteria bacterium]
MSTPQSRRAGGFSLVELMVAVTISLIMMAVIIELFASNKQAYRVQEGASELNENARYAVAHLQYYLRLADHWGGVEAADITIDPAVPSPLSTDCSGDPVIQTLGFRGYDGNGATPPLDCVAASDYVPNTDAFFIRYGAAHEDARSVTDPGEPVPSNGVPMLPDTGELPVRAGYLSTTDGAGIWLSTRLGRRGFVFANTDHGSLPSDGQLSDAEVQRGEGAYYRVQSMLYYIRPCSNPAAGTDPAACDAGDDAIPTLVRRALTPDLGFAEDDIVAGVENMQLLYGVDGDGDFVAERYEPAATVTANNDWSNVITVRVSLVVANLQRDTTINDTNTYYLLDTTWQPPPAARSFRRSQFDFTVQIRNITRA